MNMEPSVNYEEIKNKLVKMAKLAAERMSTGAYSFEVNGKKRYVRINSSKFRAVSLDAENPCGHLVRDKKPVGVKMLESARSDAADRHCENHNPGNKKPEHRVQAFVIWQALTNPRGLPKVLGIERYVDALWFVTDELSLPPIRADIIMLGERGGLYFPVFIELKHGRTTEVERQLNGAVKIATEVSKEFRQFLSDATGKPIESIQMEHSMPMAIWGYSGSPRPEAQIMSTNLLTICHSEVSNIKENAGYGVFTFSKPL